MVSSQQAFKSTAMKKIYHLCLSSHDEVLFRSESDLIRGFNALALASLTTDSALLADGLLTTHLHFLTQTPAPKEILYRMRYAHARFFNAKYKRKGKLGEKYPFFLEIDGFHHTLAALNYVNRQGLHHGLSPTPFGYRHCSANSIFRKQLGKSDTGPLLPEGQKHNYLPDGVSLPGQYRMDVSGLLLREDVIDISLVESYYGTPRNYIFQMNKIGDELSRKEQEKERSDTPIITLELIEHGVPGVNIEQLLRNESGKHDPKMISDIELCELIDGTLLRKYCKNVTIYEASISQRAQLYDMIQKGLWASRHKLTTDEQLRRCLCLNVK